MSRKGYPHERFYMTATYLDFSEIEVNMMLALWRGKHMAISALWDDTLRKALWRMAARTYQGGEY
jgi:hypothetical protein